MLAIVVTFAAFWVWRVIGARLISRGRKQSATGYQVLGVTLFLFGAYAGTVIGTRDIAPPGSHPGLILAAAMGIPLGCGLAAAAFVIGWVFMLPALPPRAIETAPNPFDRRE